MYIARGPSKGVYTRANSFPPLPILNPGIAGSYASAYPGDRLRTAQGPVGKLDAASFQRYKFKHVVQRPWHDAESIALTFLIFLLRCSPDGSPDESQDDLKPMQYMYRLIQSNGIGSMPDNRDTLLTFTSDEWTFYLHQDLHHLAETLRKICAAVQPDYEFLQPSSDEINVEVVLHEVLQRILLNLYHQMIQISDITPDLNTTFSKNLRPLDDGSTGKRRYVSATESRSRYAQAGPSFPTAELTSPTAGPSVVPIAGPSTVPIAGPSTGTIAEQVPAGQFGRKIGNMTFKLLFCEPLLTLFQLDGSGSPTSEPPIKKRKKSPTIRQPCGPPHLRFLGKPGAISDFPDDVPKVKPGGCVVFTCTGLQKVDRN